MQIVPRTVVRSGFRQGSTQGCHAVPIRKLRGEKTLKPRKFSLIFSSADSIYSYRSSCLLARTSQALTRRELAASDDTMATYQPEDLPTELSIFPNGTSRQMQDLAYESNEKTFNEVDIWNLPFLAALHSNLLPSVRDTLSTDDVDSHTSPPVEEHHSDKSLRAYHRRFRIEDAELSFVAYEPPPIDLIMEQEFPEDDVPPVEQLENIQAPTPAMSEEMPLPSKRKFTIKAHIARSTGRVGKKSRSFISATHEKILDLCGCLALSMKGNSVVECTACCSETLVKEVAILSCKHTYCIECFDQLVKIGCESELSWPPRCCSKAVKWRMVAKHASKQTATSFLDLRAQCAIPLQHRWYW